MGQYVLALRMRGYDVEGAELASRTVEAVRDLRPDIPIRRADVARLEVPDGYYVGYISLGVVEHRREGPEPFLQEAYRVLKPNGVALISVPYFHPLRRIKACLGLYRGEAEGFAFYQYAFTRAEMSEILNQAGFKIVDIYIYSGFKGIKDEIPMLREMVQWRPFSWLLAKSLKLCKWADRNLGHMAMFICRKRSSVRT
jgi:SAM-dependent methyltransferase